MYTQNSSLILYLLNAFYHKAENQYRELYGMKGYGTSAYCSYLINWHDRQAHLAADKLILHSALMTSLQ